MLDPIAVPSAENNTAIKIRNRNASGTLDKLAGRNPASNVTQVTSSP